jgi:hypothetical protein
MSVFPECAGKYIDFALSRASIPERDSKCDHFHPFSGVILRYLGANAVLSNKGGAKSQK